MVVVYTVVMNGVGYLERDWRMRDSLIYYLFFFSGYFM
jgi:hypothetical protein